MQQASAESAAAAIARAWRQAAGARALIATPDPVEACGVVGRVFRPHKLVPHAPGGSVRARMDYLPAGLLSLSRLRYGAEVDILPGPLERFYLVQVPVAGGARIETGGIAFDSTPRLATLLSPAPDLAMRWGADSDQVILRIDAEPMRRFCAAWVGDDAMGAPTFDPRLPLDAALVQLIESAIALASLGESAGERQGVEHHPYPLSVLQLRNRLLAALLGRQPHDASARLASSSPPLAPRYVRLVEDYLIAHPHEPITPERLAELSGVSVRSLFHGFARYRRVSPMKLLREIRLARVRDELLTAAPGARVTEVALRWGFWHLGRFSAEYRGLFGETPSQTLARG